MGRAIGSVIAQFLVDEDLSPRPINLLRQLGYDVDRVSSGAKDPEIIRNLGVQHGCRGVWITADRAAMTDHRIEIIDSGISVALMNFNNALRDTQSFMIFSFLYRRGGLTRNCVHPTYFKLDVSRSNLTRDIRIRRFNL